MAADLPLVSICLSPQGMKDLINCTDSQFECEGNKTLFWSTDKNRFHLKSGKMTIPLAEKFTIPIVLWLVWLRKNALQTSVPL